MTEQVVRGQAAGGAADVRAVGGVADVRAAGGVAASNAGAGAAGGPKHLARPTAPAAHATAPEAHARYYGLDLLKVMAILVIAMHHFQQDFGVTYAHLNFYGGRLYLGFVVELFFMISGFVMVVSESRRSQTAVVGPLVHRLKRLWPPAAVSVLAATALWPAYEHFSGLLWDGQALSLKTFLISLSTISQGGLFGWYSYNNPLWYVGVLILCYVAFYLLRRLAAALHIPAWPLFVAMVVLGWYGRMAQVDVPFLMMNSSARGYAAFFTGTLLGMVVPRLQDWRHANLLAAMAGVVALAGFAGLWVSDTLLMWEWQVEMCLVWPELVVLCTLGAGVQKISNNPVIGFLGRTNYAFYVWHEVLNITIGTICAALAVPTPTTRLDMLLYLLLAEAVAAVMYYLVERPLAKLFR